MREEKSIYCRSSARKKDNRTDKVYIQVTYLLGITYMYLNCTLPRLAMLFVVYSYLSFISLLKSKVCIKDKGQSIVSLYPLGGLWQSYTPTTCIYSEIHVYVRRRTKQ